MVTLAVLITILAAILFGVAICVIVGGVAGIGIVADILVAVFIIGLFIKMLIGR